MRLAEFLIFHSRAIPPLSPELFTRNRPSKPSFIRKLSACDMWTFNSIKKTKMGCFLDTTSIISRTVFNLFHSYEVRIWWGILMVLCHPLPLLLLSVPLLRLEIRRLLLPRNPILPTPFDIFVLLLERLCIYLLTSICGWYSCYKKRLGFGESLISKLSATFTIRDLGAPSFFLDIETIRESSGLLLSQRRYMTDILRRAGMADCKLLTTPIPV